MSDTRLLNEFLADQPSRNVRDDPPTAPAVWRAIAGENPADQPQRSADEVLRFALAIKLVVGNRELGDCGGVKLRLEPAGIEQQRVELLALARLGEVVRKVEVEVAAGSRVDVRARRRRRAPRRVACAARRGRPSRPGRAGSDGLCRAAGRSALIPDRRSSSSDRSNSSAKQIVGLEILKSARCAPTGAQQRRSEFRHPLERRPSSPKRTPLGFGLGQPFEADVDRSSATALARSASRRADRTRQAPSSSSRSFTSAIADRQRLVRR